MSGEQRIVQLDEEHLILSDPRQPDPSASVHYRRVSASASPR